MKKTLTVVAFGDSITEATTGIPNENKRWLNILDKELKNVFPGFSFKLVNSGVGGNSDREKMLRFEKDVLAYDPDVLLLEFGGNNTGFRNPGRLISPEETMKYLEQIKNKISAKTKIIVITFPYVIENLHACYVCGEDTDAYFKYFGEFGGTDGAIELYREKCRKFAAKYDLPVVNFNVIMREDANPDRFTLQDGVHLTEEGNQLLAELVLDAMKDLRLKNR